MAMTSTPADQELADAILDWDSVSIAVDACCVSTA